MNASPTSQTRTTTDSFERRAAAVREDLALSGLAAQEALGDMAKGLRAFGELLEFECDRILLRLDKLAWASVVDRAEIAALTQQRDALLRLRNAYDPAALDALGAALFDADLMVKQAAAVLAGTEAPAPITGG